MTSSATETTTVTTADLAGAVLSSTPAIRDFVFAGKAIFTLVSKATGSRFTYKVARADGTDGSRPWFVSILAGPDNGADYSYVGAVFPSNRATCRLGRNSHVSKDATSYSAISWFLAHLDSAVAGRSNKIDRVEFWHAGRCGRCGRRLTVPSSIASGLGPTCAGKE
jgi:hypothetical protein